MSESVSFKVYLKRDGQEVEVRRFGIDGGAATNYMYLRGKIQAMFPSIQNDQYNISWQDSDNDYVSVNSDEELLMLLTSSTVQPFKLYVQVKSQNQTQGGSSSQAHGGVTCDACEGPVVGYRYKCVTCPDFDLCSACEAANCHPEHFMLRMPTPIGFGERPKFLRKIFGRPNKFHKRHYGWNRHSDMPGDASGGGPCPFMRGGGPPAPGFTDMFDFSALSEFISSLGVATGVETEANEPAASAQTTPGAQAQPSQPTSSQPNQAQGGLRSTEYLNNIGQAITAFLDPFGVDVTFDVRSKSTGQAKPSTSAQPNPPAAPTQTPPVAPTQTPPAQSPSPAPSASARSETAPTPAPETPVTQVETVPVASPPVAFTVPARRNSDDWTILNRESPTRSDIVVMDVDESHGAKTQSVNPPEPPKDVPSAPPKAPTQAESGPADIERLRIQEAVERIRSMGFDFETSILRELVRRENCDIASVLEMILSNAGKK